MPAVIGSALEAAGEMLRRQATTEDTPACDTGNEYNGRMGVRISAVFVIFVTSAFGALFPVIAKRNKNIKVPEWAFFFAKYFGSGVIVATAFIHLMSPANDALTDPCLTGVITEYPWAQGISLMSIFVLFFVELLVMRFATFGSFIGHDHAAEEKDHSHPHSAASSNDPHFNHHLPEHQDTDAAGNGFDTESYAAQLTALFILEFGIIFHSIFIGLTLAVSGAEFATLYCVLVFHQMFEGLGLGSRLSSVPFPKSKRWTPHLMAMLYGVSTPLAIAVGLGVRTTYPPGGYTTLIVNGVFDSISAGILLYTGLVELMAHEFLFSSQLRSKSVGALFSAFGIMCAGAGIMALLGKWA
ncbi:low-affinity Zn(2+) transporter zrt2 [Rhizina undulata]